MDTKSILSFSSLFLVFICINCDVDINEPTGTLSLVNTGGSGHNRFALQVSGDQISEYLRTLRHVPDSIYNGAHIIADMDESAVNTRYETEEQDAQDNGRYYNERIPATRLHQQQAPQDDQAEDEQEDYSRQPKHVPQDDYETSSSRRNNDYYEPKRQMDYRAPFRMSDYLRSRDLFLRREEAADQEAKADKEAANTAAKLKEFLNAKQDMEDSAKEELISPKSKTEIDEKSAGKSGGKKDSTEDKTDIDLKTVRELLNTLIKQIENIQAAAKALPLASVPAPVSYPSSPAPPAVSSSKKDHRDEMESHIEVDHVPKRGKYPSYEMKKRPNINNKKVKPNQRTVFLKPQDVMRMLTGSQDLPSDFMPDVVPIQRRTRGPYMTSSSVPRGMRSLPFYPMPYGGGYPGLPGGYNK